MTTSPDATTPLMHQIAVSGLIAAVKRLGPAEYRMPPQQWANLILAAERAAEFLGEIERRRQARLRIEKGETS